MNVKITVCVLVMHEASLGYSSSPLALLLEIGKAWGKNGQRGRGDFWSHFFLDKLGKIGLWNIFFYNNKWHVYDKMVVYLILQYYF